MSSQLRYSINSSNKDITVDSHQLGEFSSKAPRVTFLLLGFCNT